MKLTVKYLLAKIEGRKALLIFICPLTCIQLLNASSLLAQTVPEELNLIKIRVGNQLEIEALENAPQVITLLEKIRGLGFYYVSLLEPGFVWAMVTDVELELLKEREYEFTNVTKGPVIDLFKYRHWGPSMEFPEVYHTYEEVVTELSDLHAEFPLITKIEIIGQTQQFRRDIYAVKVSDNARVREDEPRILFSATIHGDEVINTEICMALLNDILDKYEAKHKGVRNYVSQYEIWFIPIINVDGHHIATHANPNWRRNARDVDGDGNLTLNDGVDLNRNFDFNWNRAGTLESGKYDYRGDYPFSEAESRCLKNFVREQKFVFSITYHSAEEIVYYPWKLRKGQLMELAPEDELLTELATNIGRQIKCINEKYTYKPVRNTRYAGYTSNYYYAALGTIDFMIETGKYDHVCPEDTLTQIIKSNLPGAYYLLERAVGPGLTGHITDAATGQPIEAEIRIVEFDDSSVCPRTSDSKTGRYFRILQPGTYTALVLASGKEAQLIRNLEVKPEGWTIFNVELQ